MFWGVRHSDGTIERWEAILYRPPLQVVIGWKKPPTARWVTAGSGFGPPELMEDILIEVHSGPGAEFPKPPTAREFARAIEDEWLTQEKGTGLQGVRALASAIREYFLSAGTRQNFKQNDHVRMRSSIGDMKVTVVGPYDTSLDLWTVTSAAGINFVISGHVLEKRDPQWRAGDVIVVKHQGYGPAYTYVRSTSGWLTEHGTKTDETVNKWYRAGWVTPKLQSNGDPFDASRL